MKRLLASWLFILLITCVPALSQASAKDEKDINGVVKEFGQAIVNRDKPGFIKLFMNPSVTWQSVLSDESLAQIKKRRPDAVKAKYQKDLNANRFIDGIVNSKNTSEETFSNIKIDTDGDVAVVSFDYSFLSNGRKTNWGKECWLLVRTGEGWKITTLAYSVIYPSEAT